MIEKSVKISTATTIMRMANSTPIANEAAVSITRPQFPCRHSLSSSENAAYAAMHGDSGSGNGSGDGSGGGGGEIPSGRSSLVSQVYKNSLYIFGGKGFVYAQTLQPLFILV